MKKLIRDTLMNPRTGEWSRKNITACTSFIVGIIYAFTGSIFADKVVHEFIFFGFMGLTTSMLGISTWEKKNLKTKTDDTNVA